MSLEIIKGSGLRNTLEQAVKNIRRRTKQGCTECGALPPTKPMKMGGIEPSPNKPAAHVMVEAQLAEANPDSTSGFKA